MSIKQEDFTSDLGFRIGPGMFVQLAYRVEDADGEAVGPSEEMISVVYGMGQLLPKVEQAIDGLGVGETRVLKLAARDAYGPRDPEAVLEVDRAEFPEDAVEGDYFEIENADGELLVLRVLEVADDYVRVDLNHPLAGQDLQVSVTANQVRPATQEELALAEKSGLEEESQGSSGLIAPQSLLRGPKRR